MRDAAASIDLESTGTIAAAAAMLARKQISVSDLIGFYLDRIERLDHKLHAFVAVTRQRALDAARAADAEIRERGPRGPLHGIPFAVKDVYDVAGLSTTAGSKAFLNNVAISNATAVSRLEDAGAILLGKLATHELTHGGVDAGLPWPPVRNPWNTDHDSGGSSSGAGAAVAAGLCCFALGTDTGGSIRKPAGLCGIAGLKPTFGRVSRKGVMLNASSLDHCGPLAWTARDCALVLQTIAGVDELDPDTHHQPDPAFLERLDRSIEGFRIGVASHFWESDLAVDPQVIEALKEALGVFKSLGARIEDIRLASLAEYNAPKVTIQRAEIFATYGDELRRRPEDFGPRLRSRMVDYDKISAVDYVKAQRRRVELTAQMKKAMSGFDVLVTAGPGPAPRLDHVLGQSRAEGVDLTLAFNMTGFPAISICDGFTRQGLPLAMQIVGKPFEEARLLQIAHCYENATPWRASRPGLQ
jgi:aspartyl-tRNA(Asn)/glutamyl-tRNA(Gln) amidotransferase subunit A